MKKIILNLLTLSLILSFIGCSTHDVSNTIDNTLAQAAGNKPAKFFNFTEPKYVHRWKFRHKDYEALSPFTKDNDWSKMSGWDGGYFGNSIAIGLRQGRKGQYNGISYALDIHTSILNYTDREKAIETNDIDHIKNRIRLDKEDKLTIEHHGKGNYPCVVVDTYDKKRGIRKKIYDCYKFNLIRTKAKDVTIVLIYTKSPNLPSKYKSLAKEYTYKDLQKRAKRVLDSLYIKDGWSK